MPRIDKILPSIEGSDFYITQDHESSVILYALRQGQVKKFKAPTNKGAWNELNFTQEEYSLLDKDIQSIDGDFTMETSIMLLHKNDEVRVVKEPDDTGAYGFSSSYRLYWAYDTKKMYINIADQWVFCGTLNHDLLDGVGKYSHKFIDEFIDAGGDPEALKELWDVIKSLQEDINTLYNTNVNGMGGDINLIPGDNITITKDIDTKSLKISSSGGSNVTRLGELEDVKITGADKGQVLMYDVNLTKWVNTDAGLTKAGVNVRYIIDSILGYGEASGAVTNPNLHVTKIKVYDMDGVDIAPTFLDPRGGFGNTTLNHSSSTTPSTIRNCYENPSILTSTYTEARPINGDIRTGLIFETPNNTPIEISRVQVWHYYGDSRQYRNEELYISMDGVDLIPIIKHTDLGPAETNRGQDVVLGAKRSIKESFEYLDDKATVIETNLTNLTEHVDGVWHTVINHGNDIRLHGTRLDTIEDTYDKTIYIKVEPDRMGNFELDAWLTFHWDKIVSGESRTVVLLISDLKEINLDKCFELPENFRMIATQPVVIKCSPSMNNPDTTSDAYFMIRGDRTYMENITMIPSDPTTETKHAISFIHQSADGRYVSHIGNEFYKCMFQEWKSKAIKSFGGWHKKFDLCIFKWCSTGIDYHAMDVPNDGWWSASGDIFERCTFIENDIGIYAEYHKQLAINSCTFEFNGCPFDLVSCDGTVFKNPWLEANYGPARISGEIICYGGRGFDTFGVEFKKDADKLITLFQNGVKQYKGNVLIASDMFDAWNTVASNSFELNDGWYFEGAHINPDYTMLSGNPILTYDIASGFVISPPISLGQREWEITLNAYNPTAASKIKIVPRVIDVSSGNPSIIEFLTPMEITLDGWGAWVKKRVTFTPPALVNGNILNFAFEVVTKGGQLEIGDIIISKQKGLTDIPVYKAPANVYAAPNHKLFTYKANNDGSLTTEQFYFK